MSENTPSQPLSRLLNPRSVAIVGASRTPEKYGHLVPRCLLDGGYQGEVYLINPREGEALGRNFHASLTSIGHPVDLVVSVLPLAKTLAAVEDCAAAEAGGVVLLAAGFAEAGNAGLALQNTVREIAQKAGVRVVGPNCLGLFNASARLNVMANDDIPVGSIAFITQSGGFAEMFFHDARRLGGGLSLCVSVGNQADVALQDVITYAAADAATKVIAVYVEGASDGPAFIGAVHAAAKVKPVVVLKGGRGDAGARATASHTASLAGSADVYDALLREAGAVVVAGLSDFYPVASTLALAPVLRGAKVALLGGGGGQGTVMADAMEQLGVEIPALPQALQEQLVEVLWERSSVANPVEFAGASERSYSVYEKCAELILCSDAVDGLAVFGSFGGFRPELETEDSNYAKSARALAEISRRTGKPLIVQTYFAGADLPALEVLKEEGIACFASPEIVATCFAALAHAGGVLAKTGSASSLMVSDPSPTSTLMSLAESSRLLKSKGLDVVPLQPAESIPEATGIANRIGYPVVLKLLEPSVVHKTDQGLVAPNLCNDNELAAAIERMHESQPVADAEQIVFGIGPMVRSGVEALVGAVRDPTFGPLVMVGSGGIYLEIYRDIAIGLAGLPLEQAIQLIERTKLHQVLRGTRGGAALDICALASAVVGISELMLQCPAIMEIDLNPVFVQRDGIAIADVRILTADE